MSLWTFSHFLCWLFVCNSAENIPEMSQPAFLHLFEKGFKSIKILCKG